MKEIKRHIKNQSFCGVYLLTGDEEYLIAQARELLKRGLVEEGDTMNCTVYEDTRVDLTALAELAGTYPFFSRKRLIVLDRTGILKTGKEALIRIFEQLPDTTCIILCEPEADKRTKVYKWIKAHGYVGEFLKKNQTEQTLLRFIAGLLGKENIKIREKDALALLRRTGSDMYQLKNEVDKLIAYLGEEKVVSGEAIEAIVSGEVENKIFDLVSAIAETQKERALSLYNDLILLKEEPMHMMYLIARQYRLLTVIFDMRQKRKSEQEIARTAGIPGFAVRRYYSQLAHYDRTRLTRCLNACARAEQAIKEGRISDRLSLETLIVQLLGA